ncbi:cation:dicarboxylase symporter family transporter [Lactobacillus sp. S2-2]|uniref:cation:dicarboxylate symporter family transporter n=1 Tax=Lactobacillus sp. S2-2 TaxID=2692917 RepID=UPI001F02F577|nr:cation:dicarboxylase symporter family transporter [Lactobacillus sp. S2-2]MCF6515244.1 cation:dicarboxylase symporter family transporter [Lactobacillus sp. S2-2]
MDNIYILILIVLAAIILAGIGWLQKRQIKFNRLVLLGLVIGLIFGGILQWIFGANSNVVFKTTDWLSIVGQGYITLLQMLVIPLIIISLISAFTKLESTKNFGKITRNVLTVLLSTTAVAALIGIGSVILFKLQGASFAHSTASSDTLQILQQKQDTLSELSIPQKIVSVLPQNIFADLAGTRSTSTISVVIFSLLVGFSFIWLKRNNPKAAETFANGTNSLDAIISRLVKIIIALTPYGIFALMTKTVAINSLKTIESLGVFIIAGYFALILVLIVHTLILIRYRVNPINYYKKVATTLIFAFTSRSSAGSLPMNVEAQTNKLGINRAIADFSASFGLSIGQNGCAGVYPAMVASITAAANGVDITSFKFIISLVIIVTISSFGVAGSGGGATFATLIVLGTLNLPVGVMAIILAIDPIIDMGRTLVNVNDSIIAGLVTAKRTNMIDEETLAKTE